MQAFNVTQQRTLARVLTVADSFFRSLVGLMGRSGLEVGHGLWIVPCQSVHTFWMRFPIDVVFVAKDGTVAKICSGVKPWRTAIAFGAFAAIELAAGGAGHSGTAVGDRLRLTVARG